MESFWAILAEALKGELEQLKAVRNEMVLCGGERIGTFAGYTYYRFELPEDILPHPIERSVFIFGQKEQTTVSGNIIEIDNQFLTIALPRDFGQSLPEVKCTWNYEAEFQPIIDTLAANKESGQLAAMLFDFQEAKNSHIVSIEPQKLPTTPPDQFEAVKKIFANKLTLLWGPIHAGKTYVLGLAAANYLAAGKSVLIVSPSNEYTDEMLLRTASLGKSLGLDMEKLATRIDLPSINSWEEITPYSFEYQVELMKAEKRKIFQERVSLLEIYWNVKAKQILYEDFYSKVQNLRDHLADLRRQAEQVQREISQLNTVLSDHESSSIIERMKRGLSKDELAEIQKKLSDFQQRQKYLTSMQQAVTNEIHLTELNAPISADEWKAFREAMKRIEELGGFEQVDQSVEQYIAVNEQLLLFSKQLVCTNIVSAFLEQNIRIRQYDMVIVDEAQRVNLPTLAALATLAREKLIIAGDPFQVEPESVSNNESAQQWLQRDIFLHAAKTKELHRLFEWAEQNSRWIIQLKSQFATTPKLSLFMASVLYDDKINVFVSPKAKGKIYFIDTSDIRSRCKQYAGKKRILPYNELHTRTAIECVKHALSQSGRHATDVGIIFPFTGPTLYTKLQLRLQGMSNIEVGTPQTFCDRSKAVIIFDATMAGVDYTMRSIDDRKVGEYKIARLFNTMFSCVGEDLYIIADLSHLRSLYKDRLFTRLLMLLQSEADIQQPSFAEAVKQFDSIDLDKRDELFSFSKKKSSLQFEEKPSLPQGDEDHELALQMKMMAAKKKDAKPIVHTRTVERDTYLAVQRVLGYREDVNLLSQFVGGDILFRNSFATEQAIGGLPFDVCENEKNFRSIMDKWNLLIYEMSGGSKTDSPFFSGRGPESRPRLDIRNLTAIFSSNIEALLLEGKQKIATEVSRLFQELLGKSQPGNPVEWSSSYLSFLVRVESYLAWISEQLRR